MALFADQLIVSAFRFFKRQKLIREASKWNIVPAKIRQDTSAAFSAVRQSIAYTYEIDGETHYGFATGEVFARNASKLAADFFKTDPTLQVRVNPADPLDSRLLNEDNPKLPFTIDHLPD